ncbi:MAG: ATP-binding protein [Bacteroidetes bacterium HGW-Bacteroidetes-21]|jgi:DNA replication protein DnaC|nr:MAG: ATP-binding protein [Bacteroidetes bacterium HGW-Bacteroidetes-21]
MTHEIIHLMQQLRLTAMRAAFEGIVSSKNMKDIGNDELLNLLLQAEWDGRENQKSNRRLQNAHFRFSASIEEIDWVTPRGINKTQLLRFTDASFVKNAENILVTGPTGVGKSYMATALGHLACQQGYKVSYFLAQKLFATLRMSKADESYMKLIKRIERQDVIIIDDFGMQPLDQTTRMMLLEIIEDRHQTKSTIIASQLPVEKWYEVIGESTVADAILDRLVHTAHRIELSGESMRKKKKQ